MNFSFFISKRYFSHKYVSSKDTVDKSKINFVHIISLVSLIGVAVGTASLILVLSVFNGFEDLILKMYNSFNPDIKITSYEGGDFDQNKIIINSPEIEEKAFVLEEKVLLKYQEKEFIAVIKGVSATYKNLVIFDSLLVEGRYIDSYTHDNVAVIGRGVAYFLSIGLEPDFQYLQVFAADRSVKQLINTQSAFAQGSVLPIGIFGVQAEIDEEYVITPLSFIQKLTQRHNKITSVELKIRDFTKIREVQEQLQLQYGDEFLVQNRMQQQDFLYKILNTEKLSVYLILTFIMIIATFNIFGSLSMLILDKKQDIKILKSFGVTQSQIRTIFFNKSLLTIFLGIFTGLVIGLILAWLQQTFGLISMGNGSFVVDAYPVLIKSRDILIVSFTVIVIGILASFYPAHFLSRKLF